MTGPPGAADCPHGDPRPTRCALCRRDRRRESERARLRAALLTRPDFARHAANDHDDDRGDA